MSFGHAILITRAINADPARITFVYVFGLSNKNCRVASPNNQTEHARRRIGFKSSGICDVRELITFFMHVNMPNRTIGEMSMCKMLLRSSHLSVPTGSIAETERSA